MKNRYLCRGKCRDTGEWRVGNLGSHGHKLFIDTTPTDGGKHNARVDLITVGQCTGMKDINDKLIFEYDYVRS